MRMKAWIKCCFVFVALAVPSVSYGQQDPGENYSTNMKLIAHLPLGDSLPLSEIEIEQEMSRPYVYVSRSRQQMGFDIIDVRDNKNPKRIYQWGIEEPALHQ